MKWEDDYDIRWITVC